MATRRQTVGAHDAQEQVKVIERDAALAPDQLTRRCPPERFSFTTTAEIQPGSGTIGQERGVASLEFGLAVRTAGYNLYVAGIPGTGKNTTTLELLHARAAQEPVPLDWCYVYNFDDPHRPVALGLPAGQGRALAAQLDELIAICQRGITHALESEQYAQRRGAITQRLQVAREALLVELTARARELGFALEPGPSGILTVPIERGRPLTREEFDALQEDQRADIQRRNRQLQPLISRFVAQSRALEKTALDEARALDRETANFVLAPLIGELREQYAEAPRVLDYLRRVQEDLLANLDLFRRPPDDGQSPARAPSDDPFARYRVNVIVDNSGLTGAPVVVEHSPTYYNLCGRIDYVMRQGAPVTDFRLIKGGALHRANGGYLVLQARDVLAAPFAWDALKRTLRAQAVRPENLGDQYSAIPTMTLRPEPIPVDLKVVLIGDAWLYRTLRFYDEDFQKNFKVRADFDTTMPRTERTESDYAGFVARQCRQRALRPFDRAAVARVVDFGARLAGDCDKLSTCFSQIATLVVEASHWAGAAGREIVTSGDVERAIAEHDFRSRMVEDKFQEYVANKTILVDVTGQGRRPVNGLSVIGLGDYTFGRPNRITARAGVGNAGVVHIEREVKRSGPIHSKGVLTLVGYLIGQYGQTGQLSLSASLGFEQLYEEIDGDSASSAELYALLSTLSGLPLRQGIAVTGSVNQRGQVQAIGGVNEKIEGFFAICKQRGLTGDQGVMIPRANVRNLLLKDEIVAAVREGTFHVWAIANIDEGIELLTGTPAGTADADGRYPPESVHGRVAARIATFAERMTNRDTGKSSSGGAGR